MTIKIFLNILLWNLAFTVLTSIVGIAGIYFFAKNIPFFVNPLILFGVVLIGQLYFNSWLLGKRRIYNVQNLIYCYLQLSLLWFVFYFSFALLAGEQTIKKSQHVYSCPIFGNYIRVGTRGIINNIPKHTIQQILKLECSRDSLKRNIR